MKWREVPTLSNLHLVDMSVKILFDSIPVINWIWNFMVHCVLIWIYLTEIITAETSSFVEEHDLISAHIRRRFTSVSGFIQSHVIISMRAEIGCGSLASVFLLHEWEFLRNCDFIFPSLSCDLILQFFWFLFLLLSSVNSLKVFNNTLLVELCYLLREFMLVVIIACFVSIIVFIGSGALSMVVIIVINWRDIGLESAPY